MTKNLIIFADGHVGSEIVSWLAAQYSDDIALIFTVEENRISKICKVKKIETEVFSTEKNAISMIKSKKIDPEIGFLVWWPKILTPEILSIASSGFINTHPSLLPYARGKNYNFWTLVESTPFGVSMHFVEEGIDCGDIVAQKEVQYSWEDNGGSLFVKAKKAMIELFKDNFKRLKGLNFKAEKQNLSKGSFHYGREMDIASEIFLDQQYTSRQLLNLLRARTMEGYPACYFYDNTDKYEVKVVIKKVQ
jgi:methionyl-tRNA formyltransferase